MSDFLDDDGSELPSAVGEHLRRRLGAVDPGVAIDVAHVVVASRSRRRPRQVVAGSLGALALAGVAILAIQVTVPGQNSVTSAESAKTDQSVSGAPSMGADSSLKRAPASRVNLCGGMLAEVGAGASGLSVTVGVPVSASADGTRVSTTAVVTNSSTTRVTGALLALPTIVLSREGIVLWHGPDTADAAPLPIDLAPGESASFETSLTPVLCTADDDTGTGIPSTAPALPAGSYAVNAFADFAPAEVSNGATSAELLLGPASTLMLIG